MRLDSRVLGISRPKNSWQTISVLLMLQSFIKYRLVVMSVVAIWDIKTAQQRTIIQQYSLR